MCLDISISREKCIQSWRENLQICTWLWDGTITRGTLGPGASHVTLWWIRILVPIQQLALTNGRPWENNRAGREQVETRNKKRKEKLPKRNQTNSVRKTKESFRETKESKKKRKEKSQEGPASWKSSQIVVKCSFVICAFSSVFRLVTAWYALWLLIQIHETAHTLCGSPRLGSGELTTCVGRVDLDGCAGERGTAHIESFNATD